MILIQSRQLRFLRYIAKLKGELADSLGKGGRISLAGVVLTLPTQSFASARIVTLNTEKPPRFGGSFLSKRSAHTPRKESATD